MKKWNNFKVHVNRHHKQVANVVVDADQINEPLEVDDDSAGFVVHV